MKIYNLQLKKRNIYVMLSILVVLILMLPLTFAVANNKTKTIKDYGVRGHTFTIKERSLLEVILERLKQADKKGKIAALQEQFKEKVKAKIINPVAIAGIGKTSVAKTFFYDPSYTAVTDIKDDNKRLIVASGTTVNPLSTISWGEPLIFIDGEDETQLNWGLKQTGKIILVKGSPVLLQEKLNQPFYFDQAGILTRKFGITQVPSKVSQDGLRLKIEEVVL